MENSFNDPPEEYVPQFSQDFPDQAESQAANIADIGILCSWYTKESNSDRTFILNTEKDEVVVHQYQPISSYLCTLIHDSFKTTVCEKESSSLMNQKESLWQSS